MADRPQPHQIQVRPQYRYDVSSGVEYGGGKSLQQQHRGPSAGQVLAVVTGLPVGGVLLGLAALTLMGTVIALLVATPVFVIFSPVLVPAVFLISLAITGFLTSGAFGLTALSSLSWVVNYLRRATGMAPDMEHVKLRAADMAEYVGQKTKEVGQDIQGKAQVEKRHIGHESR